MRPALREMLHDVYPAYFLIYHMILHRLHVNGLGPPIVVSLRVHCMSPPLFILPPTPLHPPGWTG